MVIVFISSACWTSQRKHHPLLLLPTPLLRKSKLLLSVVEISTVWHHFGWMLPFGTSEPPGCLVSFSTCGRPTSFQFSRRLRDTSMVKILVTLVHLSGEKSNLNISVSKKWALSTLLPNANILWDYISAKGGWQDCALPVWEIRGKKWESNLEGALRLCCNECLLNPIFQMFKSLSPDQRISEE